jgi:hypothetical protein
MVLELMVKTLTYYFQTLLIWIYCVIDSGLVVFLLEPIETNLSLSRYRIWIQILIMLFLMDQIMYYGN